MLEQNTDRILWAIGGVLVLAIIISSGNDALPNIFKSIVDSFQARIPNF